MYVCMYVYIEVALRGIAHGKGRSNWAKGRDPSESWVQYPNPAVPTAPRHSRWHVLVHLRPLSEPTLLWAAKGVLYPHVGGTETHRAHSHPFPEGLGVWKIIKNTYPTLSCLHFSSCCLSYKDSDLLLGRRQCFLGSKRPGGFGVSI